MDKNSRKNLARTLLKRAVKHAVIKAFRSRVVSAGNPDKKNDNKNISNRYYSAKSESSESAEAFAIQSVFASRLGSYCKASSFEAHGALPWR
ncbi:hypothetical protein AVEN_96280-1 [Araneus ventricosus]|uniref:Uncharacterized protein n=1 Tax=Araneus ventricosus TaxID=182803 RepID=A0A4Y2P697_ARAVE|nr:hypothetical protein AVEN_96280-1 [Araneus ventricosus]